MGYINRFFKYEPEQYVHTYSPVPVDTYMKLAALQEDRANRAAEYQGKFDEYLSNIKAAPGHEAWRDEIVGGIMKDVEDITSKYDYSDPRFMREYSKLRGRVSANPDIKALNESYNTYMNNWDKILQSQDAKLHAYNMPGIIDDEGNIIENRIPYGQLNYVGYSDPTKAMDDYLNNRMSDVFDDKRKEGITFQHYIYEDPKTKQKTVIPFIVQGNNRNRTEFRDSETFAPLIENLVNEFKRQDTPWATWMKAKGFTENDVRSKAWDRAEALYVNRTTQIDAPSYSQLSGGGKDKDEKSSLTPVIGDDLEGVDLSKISSNDRKPRKSWGGFIDITIKESDYYNDNPNNQLKKLYVDSIEDELKKELRREPTDSEINQRLREKGVIKNSPELVNLSSNSDLFKNINFLIYPNGNLFGGRGDDLEYYPADDISSSPKKLSSINSSNTYKKGVVEDIFTSGNDFTGGYPGYLVSLVDNNGNSKKFYAVDRQIDPFSYLHDNVDKQPNELSYFVNSVKNLLLKEYGVGITTINGNKLPMRYGVNDSGYQFIEFFNPKLSYDNDKKKYISGWDRYHLSNEDVEISGVKVDPFSYAAVQIYKKLNKKD